MMGGAGPVGASVPTGCGAQSFHRSVCAARIMVRLPPAIVYFRFAARSTTLIRQGYALPPSPRGRLFRKEYQKWMKLKIRKKRNRKRRL